MLFLTSIVGSAKGEKQKSHLRTEELIIRVYDYASIAPGTLASGEEEASRIFGAGHIRLIWSGCPPCRNSALVSIPNQVAAVRAILKILPENHVAALKPAPRALGFTVPGTSFVFFDRIRVASPRLPVSEILGYVMAHEIGHLLGLHHSVGIMSEGFSRKWLIGGGAPPFGFTSEQVKEMQRNLDAVTKDEAVISNNSILSASRSSDETQAYSRTSFAGIQGQTFDHN